MLIIGAGGMLGREVADAAARADVSEVVRTTRGDIPGWLRFNAEEGRPATERLLEDAGSLDLVVNCAGVLASEIDADDEASVRRAERVNAEFPHELADVTRDRGTRIVHISTDAVFRDDAGVSYEDDLSFSDEVYGTTKRRGEPSATNALSLRCSFVGRDPTRRRGLLEWLLAQPPGAEISGFDDQTWNGLTTTQVAAVTERLLDPALFDRARGEGPVHHLFEDPPVTKHELVELCARSFRLEVAVVPRPSGRPVTRTLASRHAALRQCLESGPPRAVSLEAIAARHPHR